MSYYYQIFGWILKFFYDLVGNNYALALIIFTVFFRMILLPSTISQQKGAAKQMRMQAKLARIQEKYKDYHKPDRQQKMAEEQQALYQQEGYSSMTGGCLPLLIQVPIMYGLYGAVYKPLSYILGLGSDIVEKLAATYTTITGEAIQTGTRGHGEMLILGKIEEILAQTEGISQEVVSAITNFDFTIFGVPLFGIPSMDTLKNLGSATRDEKLLLLIPILAALTSLMSSLLIQARQNKNNPQAAQMKSMTIMTMLMMPAMSLWITFSLPAAVGVYWIISNIVAFFQTLILGYTHEPRKLLAKLMVEETIERRSREANLKGVAKLNNEN